MHYDLVLTGGDVFTAEGCVQTDVAVKNGKIAALGTGFSADKVLDVAGLTVLPGVIDSQVHFREPGNEHKEDLESGTRAAALGGVTAIFEMPNTNPSTTTPDAIADKLQRASEKAWTDYAFFMGATADNAENLKEWENLPGCSGVKIFMGSSTGNLLVEDDRGVRNVLRNGRRRVAIHCEDEARLRERFDLVKDGAPVHMHPEWRDAETALKCTTRLLKLAREEGRRVHVLHVTTADEIELLKDYKDIATVECTPQHLTLSAPEAYDRLGSYAQMNPPIRTQAHQDGLWHGLAAGVVDVIGSDHAPHTQEEKAQPYPKSPSGMPGVQTLVPVMLTHVNAGKLSLQRFVDLTSAGPARVYGIAGKGRIAVGYDADFTVVDMHKTKTITADWIASKCGWTPFDGFEATAWPIHTIIRGHAVVENEHLQGKPVGAAVRFQETL